MVSPGQTLELLVERPAVGGRMIARANGQVVLVGGGIPGERVRAHVTAVAKGVAFAEVVEVLEASPDRREPVCDPACGGSVYAHIAYPAQRVLKAALLTDALARIGRVRWSAPIDVQASPVEGYRMRARLHVRSGRCGFYREHTHDLCDARATGQLLAASVDALEAIATRLAPRAPVAQLELAENVEATERVVHIDVEHGSTGLGPDLGEGTTLTGLTVGRRHRSDRRVHVLSGLPWVTDVIECEGVELRIRRHVRAFFQGNRYLLGALAGHVAQHVPMRARAMDLYAGGGLLGLAAAQFRQASVVAIEGEATAAADLAVNAARVGGVEAIHQPVEAFLNRRRPAPDVLLLDPPRTGVSGAALAGVLRLGAQRVVYVSCDVATLARDLRRLLEAHYDLTSLRAFDFFPNTPQVEAVVVLDRR